MANEATDLLRRAASELQRLTDNTKPEQLDDATLCTEWRVRDLLNHLVGGSTMFAISAEEGDIADDVIAQLMTTDQIGDDYKGAVVQATTRAMSAFDQPGALEKMVKLPFGTMPGGIALQIAVFDVATHCCDLARATDQQVDDQGLLEAALEGGRQMIGPEMRGTGLFDDPQPEPADGSAADRLLAFAGRRLP